MRTPKSMIPSFLEHVVSSSSQGGSLRASKQLPAINELTEQLEKTPEELERSKKENYERKFRLWMPMVHSFKNDEDEDGVLEEVEVLPVDELLDRVMLRQVRIASVERGLLFSLFIFLACCSLVMQRTLADAFELESALKVQIETGSTKFSELETVDDVWTWMSDSLVESVIPASSWYNGDALDSSEEGYSSFFNKQCGGFSLVQHRTKEFSSKPYMPSYHRLYPRVWPDLGGDASTANPVGGIGRGDDVKPFGPDHDPEKFQWSSDSAGEFEGGGYMVHFPTNERKVRYMVEELKSDRFVDKATRRLMFIVTVLNVNLKLFAVIEFSVTIDAAGKVTPKTSIASLRVENFVDWVDHLRVAVECGVLLLVLYHSYKEFLAARAVGPRIYFNFWNSVDAVRQLLFYYCFVSYMVLLNDPIRRNPQDVEDMCLGTGRWMNFPKLAKLEQDYVFFSSLCLLISTMLIFKFLTPFPKFGIFVHTMNEAGKDLLNFTIILLILLFGFAIVGHILFGHVLREYATVSSCIESAVLLSIGEFDYAALIDASNTLTAAIYFYSFIFIITIVVMQMVLAIIFAAYDGVRERIDAAEELIVMPTITRKILLGRAPSLREQYLPLHEIARLSLANAWDFVSSGCGFRLRGKKAGQVVPESFEGEKVTPDSFNDEHLLQLFDSHHVFRLYGILSPKMEEAIKAVKSAVAKQRKVLRSVGAAAAATAPGGASAPTTPRGRAAPWRTPRAHESAHGQLQDDVTDPWALDQEEFCALLHALDDDDASLHIDMNHQSPHADSAAPAATGGGGGVGGGSGSGSGGGGVGVRESNELRIAKLIFSAYGRSQSTKKGGSFKSRVESRLSSIARLLEHMEAREQERDEASAAVSKEREVGERTLHALKGSVLQGGGGGGDTPAQQRGEAPAGRDRAAAHGAGGVPTPHQGVPALPLNKQRPGPASTGTHSSGNSSGNDSPTDLDGGLASEILQDEDEDEDASSM